MSKPAQYLDRQKSPVYKKDIIVISEMLEVFDYILRQNANT